MVSYKILLLGLDNSGKTSLYRNALLGEEHADLENLPPTRGIQRYIHEFGDATISIWDCGGQATYRSEYLDEKSIFIGANSIVYIVDVQDTSRFEKSVEYFQDILDIVANIDPIPQIFILFHKIDPRSSNLLRENLILASSLFKEINNYGINISNISTSINSTSTLHALGIILRNIIPGFDAIDTNYQTGGKVFLNQDKIKITKPKKVEIDEESLVEKISDNLMVKIFNNKDISKYLVSALSSEMKEELLPSFKILAFEFANEIKDALLNEITNGLSSQIRSILLEEKIKERETLKQKEELSNLMLKEMHKPKDDNSIKEELEKIKQLRKQIEEEKDLLQKKRVELEGEKKRIKINNEKVLEEEKKRLEKKIKEEQGSKDNIGIESNSLEIKSTNRFDKTYSHFKKEINTITQTDATSLNIKKQEIINPFIESVIDFFTVIVKNGYEDKTLTWKEYRVFKEFIKKFHLLKSEFNHFINENNIGEFELDRKVPLLLQDLIDKLIDACLINEMISNDDRALIKLGSGKLFAKKSITTEFQFKR
ncbi:MAG: 50S ribosome-binding GTPase [Candidatus Heimdallarchaeota archaeon]|nr:50S ribosome-binding GTPase [Candidatus Heimdallarchaeota archaeon]